MIQKKTKIICTVSDINCEIEFIKDLFENGMNVARINTAHATLEGAQRVVDNVRAVSDKIAILIDTKGPEVRLTPMEGTVGFPVKTGDEVSIYRDHTANCSHKCLHTNCASFVDDVPEGAHVLIDDGAVDLFVVVKEEDRLLCRVQNDGVIKGRKSVKVPHVHINLQALTEKDKKFVNWAIDANVDFIAHSFVRNKEDLMEIQAILDDRKSHIKIISKIENQQGVDNLDEIMQHCYGVMVARGDLGVEIPAEKIPLLQHEIVHKCRTHRKPVIIATQMLHSMIENPRPTRAEVTDIANAIFQRTDAIMLSGETAFGKYPVEAVATMAKVAIETEHSSLFHQESLDYVMTDAQKPIAAALASNFVKDIPRLPIKAVIVDTWTGRTGRYLAEFRPSVPIYAMCYRDFTMRELALVYGTFSYRIDVPKSKEDMVNVCTNILVQEGRLQKGDLVGFIGGSFDDELGASYLEFKYI